MDAERLRLEIEDAFQRLRHNDHRAAALPPPPQKTIPPLLTVSQQPNNGGCEREDSGGGFLLPTEPVSTLPNLDHRIVTYIREAIDARVADVEARTAHVQSLCESNARVLCEVASKIIEVYTEVKSMVKELRETVFSDMAELKSHVHSKVKDTARSVERLGHIVDDLKHSFESEERSRSASLGSIAEAAVRSALRGHGAENDRMIQVVLRRVTDLSLSVDDIRSRTTNTEGLLQQRIAIERSTAVEIQALGLDAAKVAQRLVSLSGDAKRMGQDLQGVCKRMEEVQAAAPQQCIAQCPGSLALHQRLNTELVLVKQSVAFLERQSRARTSSPVRYPSAPLTSGIPSLHAGSKKVMKKVGVEDSPRSLSEFSEPVPEPID